ncbi:hypothetical protein KCP73_26500 [Salmonella enterica subsp. enterica]|nr:hypothetical protein KCP73_26500 [Salmonella enterica subsp. enterica]
MCLAKGEVLDIVAEPRRIANRIVEESMIAANLCAARVLRDKARTCVQRTYGLRSREYRRAGRAAGTMVCMSRCRRGADAGRLL